jgi:hypothetical protein
MGRLDAQEVSGPGALSFVGNPRSAGWWMPASVFLDRQGDRTAASNKVLKAAQ